MENDRKLVLTRVWQKWRFSAPQTHLWFTKVWFSASTFVLKIATFAKPETVSNKAKKGIRLFSDKKNEINNMNTEDIINRIDITNEIFNRCYEIFDDLKYINTLDDNEKKIIENSRFLIRIIDYEWRILIIELHKMYYKDGNYSIIKLLNIMTNNHSSIQWENKIDLSVLKDFQLKFEDENIKDALTALHILRSKFVAHIDANSHEYNDKIEIEHVELLINLGEKVLKNISNAITGELFFYNEFKVSGLDTIVRKISRLQKETEE